MIGIRSEEVRVLVEVGSEETMHVVFGVLTIVALHMMRVCWEVAIVVVGVVCLNVAVGQWWNEWELLMG